VNRRTEHAAHLYAAALAGAGAVLCALCHHGRVALLLCVLAGMYVCLAAETRS